MGECRGMFGVMMDKDENGNLRGQRMTPFNYTAQKVVAPVAFNKMFWAEVERVNKLKMTVTPQSLHWKRCGEGLEGGA